MNFEKTEKDLNIEKRELIRRVNLLTEENYLLTKRLAEYENKSKEGKNLEVIHNLLSKLEFYRGEIMRKDEKLTQKSIECENFRKILLEKERDIKVLLFEKKQLQETLKKDENVQTFTDLNCPSLRNIL